jgi:hypothetical protein
MAVFFAGFVLSLVFTAALNQILIPKLRRRWSKWRVLRGHSPLPCEGCGRALQDDNLSIFGRAVTLGDRTKHYVEVQYRPDEKRYKWRVIGAAPATSRFGLHVSLGRTLDEALSEAEREAHGMRDTRLRVVK